jgi:hypothetical protein
MLVTDVKKKVSGQGNTYYMLDLLETTEFKDENQQFIKRTWPQLYFTPEDKTLDVVNLKDKRVNAYFSFYPQSRKSGDRVFHEIRCAIADLEEI